MAAELGIIEHCPFGEGAFRDFAATDFHHPAMPRIAADHRQTAIDLVRRTFKQLQKIMTVENQRAGERVTLIVAARLNQKGGNILFADQRIGNAYIDDGKQATFSSLPLCSKGKV